MSDDYHNNAAVGLAYAGKGLAATLGLRCRERSAAVERPRLLGLKDCRWSMELLEVVAASAITTAGVLTALSVIATSSKKASQLFQRVLLRPVLDELEALRKALAAEAQIGRNLYEDNRVFMLEAVIQSTDAMFPRKVRIDAARKWIDEGRDGHTAVMAEAIIKAYYADATTTDTTHNAR